MAGSSIVVVLWFVGPFFVCSSFLFFTLPLYNISDSHPFIRFVFTDDTL